jgi:2-polyprenyl-3-methyl-5-hydroxy-6-metoxy-1,4-benzoquinol methylase
LFANAQIQARELILQNNEKRCRWCGSATTTVVASAAKARWVVASPKARETSQLVSCFNCGVKFFTEPFSAEEFERMYSGYRDAKYQRRRHKYEPWYSKKINDAIGHSTEVLEVRRLHLEDLLNSAINPDGSKVSLKRVLDVGGDEGQFIPKLESITARAVLEISGIKPVVGVEAINSWGNAGEFKPDFIMICHVLEHLENPLETVENASKILSTGGLLYIEIPLDGPSRIPKLFSSKFYNQYTKFLCRFPLLFICADLVGLVSRKFIGLPIWGSVIKQSEHINFFNEISITQVIEAMGFSQIIDSRYKPSSGVPVLDVSALGVLFRRN